MVTVMSTMKSSLFLRPTVFSFLLHISPLPPFLDCGFSLWLPNAYLSPLPYLSKVTITGFPSWEETLINIYNLWGPLSHTHSHTLAHIHTTIQLVCNSHTKPYRDRAHKHTRTHFTTPTCPLLFLTHDRRASKSRGMTDRQTHRRIIIRASPSGWVVWR